MTFAIAAVILLAVLIVLLAALLLIARSRRLPYRRVDSLLSKAELAFYRVLVEAVAGEHEVFAKVRMADLLWLPPSAYKRQEHMNRIFGKHIDFVLCEPDSLAPLLAIELDDSSHARTDRAERDRFVDRALLAAALPLLRVPARRAYEASAVRAAVRELIPAAPVKA